MKNLFLTLAITLFPMLMSAQTAQKIGVVDTQSIFQSMPETKAAQTEIDNLSKKYESEAATMEEEIKKQYEAYMKEAETLTDAMKQRKEQDIEELQKRIMTHRQVALQDLQKKQGELMAPIQEKLKTAINKVGNDNGYAYILDASAMLYVGSTGTDITALVRSALGL